VLGYIGPCDEPQARADLEWMRQRYCRRGQRRHSARRLPIGRIYREMAASRRRASGLIRRVERSPLTHRLVQTLGVGQLSGRERLEVRLTRRRVPIPYTVPGSTIVELGNRGDQQRAAIVRLGQATTPIEVVCSLDVRESSKPSRCHEIARRHPSQTLSRERDKCSAIEGLKATECNLLHRTPPCRVRREPKSPEVLKFRLMLVSDRCTQHFGLHRGIERAPSLPQLWRERRAELPFQAPDQCFAKCVVLRRRHSETGM
jgi:hypothetical protein